jgi:hypothetical protein
MMGDLQMNRFLNPSLEQFPGPLKEAKWNGNLEQYDLQVMASFPLVTDLSECHLW